MARINRIFKVDAALIPVFSGLVITGVGLHIASERLSHHAWHAWAVAHVIFCLGFVVLAFMHIKQHLGWYKSLIKGAAKRRGPTIVLSLLVILETLSGIVLLAFVYGERSGWGHFHWIAGILLAVFGIGHFIKRLPRLKNGLSIS